ncbi:MAG: amino acid permease [Leptospiraceae bacterium]|nr:amino acid permease [Leptospiraceae bacterium]
MSSPKKFGTFSGVFTPSILTILGVIMYMRLPWIVGQAGLWMTIGIILVAHIIAVTTGLSVSSIATDKKVKAGGSYYMISRSLGLPIGGTLGIALFVGMSFSISLYLIGFSESFLNYWAIEPSLNNIRLTGSIALVLVAILTIISTSLAMKTQFIIMGAIIVSLFSIFFGKTIYTPESLHTSPIPNVVPFAVLFSIFFPAVTGFEAGVSMSGDLKDPKKSIPLGTLMAIVVGLLVYIGLAAFFAYRVNAKQLVENSGVLIDISFYAPALVAGIWGATISSAIGSILGAPRILQATSSDRITPKIFEKGYGKTNEPRNALVLTFLIAEAGILIGELDVIARIVSMFYITAYGFLNLSCTFESWVSPDFRPEFKIPWWIGISGAVTCLIIMIQLDLVAMIGSTILMSFLFLYIKKKELRLEGGDVWEGFWSSIVVRGLHKLSKSPIHERNWKPNLLLFSDIEEAPQLLEVARSLADQNGVITNFELEENLKSHFSFKRSFHVMSREMMEVEGVFTRNLECRDLYEAMNQVACYYGFSGMEPNTVLLGRAKNIKNAEKFANLVQNLEKMDYNLLMLDYNHTKGFGGYETVDIWWSGYGKNMSLALALVRFLQTSENWRDANYRFLMITEDASIVQLIRRQINLAISNYRIHGEVKVIYNGIDKKPFYEIIRQESTLSDLTFLGMPDYKREEPLSVARKINHFSENLGSILWIKASSYFQELSPIVNESKIKPLERINRSGIVELKLPDNVFISKPLEEIYQKLESAALPFYENYVQSFFQSQLKLMESFYSLAEKSYFTIEKESKDSQNYTNQKIISRVYGDFLFHGQRLLAEYKEKSAHRDVDIIREGIQEISKEIKELVQNTPVSLRITKEKTLFKKSKNDNKHIRRIKFWRRVTNLFSKDYISYEVPYRKLAQYYLRNQLPMELYKLIKMITGTGHSFMLETHKLYSALSSSFLLLSSSSDRSQFNKELIEKEKANVLALIQFRLESIKGIDELNRFEIQKYNRETVNQLGEDLDRIDANKFIHKNRKFKKSKENIYSEMDSTIQSFSNNYFCFLNIMQSGVLLLSIKNRFRTIVTKTIDDLKIDIRNGIIHELKVLVELLTSFKNNSLSFEKLKDKLDITFETNFHDRKFVMDLFQELKPAIESIPENLDIISDESLQKFENGEFHEAEVITVTLRRYIEYSIENDFLSTMLLEFSSFPHILYEANVNARGVVGSVQFGLENQEENLEQQFFKSIDHDLKNLENSLLSLENYLEKIGKNVTESLNLILEKFDVFYFVRISDNLGRYVKTIERKKYFTNIGKKLESTKSFLYDIVVRLIYGKSEAVLLARNLQNVSFLESHKIESILNTVELVTPKKEVLDALPFYYKNLFLGKTPFSKELWVGRKEELEKAASSINHYFHGYTGALFISGERECGKSWLSRYIAEKHFDLNKIYQIFPPNSGCHSIQNFEELLLKELKQVGHLEEAMQTIPNHSVLVLHDLELFWNRKVNGTEIIDKILYLIETYGEKVLFIINLNKYAYNLLGKLKSLENYSIGYIECLPFDAEELKDMLLIRHNSTGFHLEINGAPEGNISKLSYASFFNKFFNYSDGMPGTALRGWVRCIDKISKNNISIKQPPSLNISSLDEIPIEWIPYLIQFVLHKKLTLERLLDISLKSKEELKKLIRVFKRAGLLIEDELGILEINGFLYHHLIYKLNQRGFL